MTLLQRILSSAPLRVKTQNLMSSLVVALLAGIVSCSDPAPQEALKASFDWFPDQPKVGESVRFTSHSTGSPSEFQWTFNGGSPYQASGVDPTVTFASSGTYEISLVVKRGTASDYMISNITVVSK